MTKTNKEQLIENIKQATPERVKELTGINSRFS